MECKNSLLNNQNHDFILNFVKNEFPIPCKAKEKKKNFEAQKSEKSFSSEQLIFLVFIPR